MPDQTDGHAAAEPNHGQADNHHRDRPDPTCSYCSANEAVPEVTESTVDAADRSRYLMAAHAMQGGVHFAEQLTNLVRKHLRIRGAGPNHPHGQLAEQIAEAVAAALEEHRPVELLESATVLRLQPGDVVTIKVARLLSDQERDATLTRIAQTFPDNAALLLEEDADITITRHEGTK